MSITAAHITNLLAKRHKKDLFIPQCKDGATQSRDHFKQIDALAFVPTWVRNEVHGYEIKVSRRDFVADQKMLGYLDMCSAFWIVCPRDVCDVSEIPIEAGLINITENGKGLRTIRKAPIRKVSIPEDVYRYIFYSRVNMNDYRYDPQIDRETRVEIWRELLDGMKLNKKLGHELSHKIPRYFEARKKELAEKEADLNGITWENDRLKRRVEQLEAREKEWNDSINGPLFSELKWLVNKYSQKVDTSS